MYALAAYISTDIPSPTEVDRRLCVLAAEQRGFARRCEEILRNATTVEKPSEIEGTVEYDRFFGVCRVDRPGADLMAAQIAATSAVVLTELSRTVLAADELVAVLSTLGDLTARFPVAAANLAAPRTEDEVRADEPAAASVEDRALYRWVIGHHLFNLASVFCIEAVNRARRSALDGDAAGTAAALVQAAGRLRATTAAMWFAGAFPASAYLGHVRPAMAAASGSEGGFSGTQNLDYHRLRRAIDGLRESLPTMPVAGAPNVRAAHAVFTETEIEDVEHHVLIAAAKVGGIEPSLLTSASLALLPVDLERAPAVEVLRDMAALRRANRDRRP